MLIAAHVLFSNTLLTIVGEDPLRKLTMPDEDDPAQELFRNVLASIRGEALDPRIAAPLPVEGERLSRKMFPWTTLPAPLTLSAVPKTVPRPFLIVKPIKAPRGPMSMSGPLAV